MDLTNINKDAVSVLVDSISKAVLQGVKKAKKDETFEGEIESVEENGKYLVSINGQTYHLYSSTDQIFIVHDKVWVTLPRNNKNKKYISGRRIT